MTVTASSFRANFSEFASRTAYTDTAINFWLLLAQGDGGATPGLLNPSRWGTKIDLGAQLFVAHNLVLEKQALDAANQAGTPGLEVGAVSGRTVDKVSVNYDAAASMLPDAGHWNKTTFGARFIYLVRLFGAGPVQV